VVAPCRLPPLNGESVEHLLLYCEIASVLWIMPRREVDLFAYCRVLEGWFWLDIVWKMILPYLMWCLLRERNGRSFEDYKRTLVELKDFFFKTLSLGCCLVL
jgi:hypothetical protein